MSKALLHGTIGRLAALFTIDLTVLGIFRKDRQAEDVFSGNKTLVVADCGVVQSVAGTSVITLPVASVEGQVYIIEARNSEGSLSVSPNSADAIVGGKLTGTTDTDFVLLAGAKKAGDRLVLVADGTLTYRVMELIGSWTVAV